MNEIFTMANQNIYNNNDNPNVLFIKCLKKK